MVWKGCAMKIELDFNAYHSNLIKKISDYAEIEINRLLKEMIISNIEKFDSDMMEFIEKNVSDSYYDDYTNRYID